MINCLSRYHLNFQTFPTLAFIVLLPLLIYLGNWQLGRSQEKQQLLDMQKIALNEAALDLSAVVTDSAKTLRYRQASAIGHYDGQHQFLLDNQISEGKPGYYVLTPFVLANRSEAILVNRGWIPLGQNRTLLPNVALAPAAPLIGTISGRINSFPGIGIILPGAEQPSDSWPSRVQVINSRLLSEKLGYPLLQFQLELAEDQPNGYKRDWQISTIMLPEQHKAYAYQWFALAFVLTLLFIRYSVVKSDD